MHANKYRKNRGFLDEKTLKKAAFFDRDGTLIEDVGYLSRIDQVKIIPGVVDLCKKLQASGFLLLVVTNQSGVARGYIDEEFVEKANLFIKELFFAKDVFFEKFYCCPHYPEAKLEKYNQNCFCRKPAPGMLKIAATEFDLDLSQSLMFGDKRSDLEAGAAAGCKSFLIKNILKTGFLTL